MPKEQELSDLYKKLKKFRKRSTDRLDPHKDWIVDSQELHAIDVVLGVLADCGAED